MPSKTRKRTVLLNPGPVNVSERVRRSLLKPDICHREPEFSSLLLGVRQKLLEIFAPKGGFTAVFFTGSGTAAVESAVSSLASPGGKILVISNGVYGERIGKMAEVHGVKTVVLSFPWCERPDPERIRQTLRSDPDIEIVALVHHETTTGLLNPVGAIGKLAWESGKIFLVDSVSGLGAEEIDLYGSNISACTGTANKAIQGLPGVSFVLVRKEISVRIDAYPPRSVYLDLSSNRKAQERGEPLFTPGIPALHALDEALNELKREGLGNRIGRLKRYSTFLREGMEKTGLEFLIDKSLMSNSITSLKLPKGIRYETLHDALKKEGFVIYAGQGSLSKEIFRVANMGNLKMAELGRFLKALKRTLGSCNAA